MENAKQEIIDGIKEWIVAISKTAKNNMHTRIRKAFRSILFLTTIMLEFNFLLTHNNFLKWLLSEPGFPGTIRMVNESHSC